MYNNNEYCDRWFQVPKFACNEFQVMVSAIFMTNNFCIKNASIERPRLDKKGKEYVLSLGKN